jgi:succinate-semialdehyde dehydrogenase / glutarate-semialdehyde dehydrogenase
MTIETINPNSGAKRESISVTPVKEITNMVAKAHDCQQEWAQLDLSKRCELLQKIAAECTEQSESLAAIMHEEMGKPLDQCIGEVRGYCSGITGEIETMSQAMTCAKDSFEGGTAVVHYLPIGVVAAITPWNFPFGMPWTLLVPALLGGNAVLFKPSEICPGTGIAMAAIFCKFLPDNILQTVVGAGDQGAALANSSVDLITFVGSRETGKKIMETASKRATRVLLEMGGKDPMIVAKDADLDAAARYAAIGSNRNTGQVCVSVERIYVDEAVVSEFTQLVKQYVNQITVGAEEKSESEILNIGPLSNQKQRQHIQSQLKEAVSLGARIEAGGETIDRPGFWMRPAVVTGVTDDMSIMREETFGPVTCIQTVSSLDEAIKFANGTRFGLGASLWTQDQAKAEELALSIESGMVGVNRSFGGSQILLWAGAKESGYGHTGGISGMRNFLQPRTVTIAK